MSLGIVLLTVKAAVSFSAGVFVYPRRSTVCSVVRLNICAFRISYNFKRKFQVMSLQRLKEEGTVVLLFNYGYSTGGSKGDFQSFNELIDYLNIN